jgi:hypothetical protein
MANEDPVESTRPRRDGDDDFSVELDWGDAATNEVVEPTKRGGSPAELPEVAAAPAHLIPADADEDPVLVQIQQALEALRSEVAELRATVTDRPARHNGVATPQDLVLEELAALRADIVALKRRLAVRAEAPPVERTQLDAEQLARLVAERLAGWSGPPTSAT